MKKQIDLYKFTSKDDTRPVMQCVYHDGEAGMAVASDATIMVVSRQAYDPAKAGTPVRKDGGIPVYEGESEKAGQPLRYPKWKEVVPKHNINDIPVDQLREAVRRADNFRKNLPKTYEDGTRIYRRNDRINIAVRADGKDRDGVAKTFEIFLSYRHAKALCEFPAEGGKITFEDERRPVMYQNDGEGLTVIVMPVLARADGIQAVFTDGIYNLCGIDLHDTENFTGATYISALGDSDDARRMYREPEQKEGAHFVKCVEQTGYDRLGGAVYGVRKRLDETFRCVPGTETFFYAIDKKQSNFPIFKKDGAYYIRVATKLVDGNWERIAAETERMGWDAMPYDQIAASQGWTAENNKTVAVWEKIKEGAGVSGFVAA